MLHNAVQVFQHVASVVDEMRELKLSAVNRFFVTLEALAEEQ